MKHRRLVLVVFTVGLLFALAACTQDTSNDTSGDQTDQQDTDTDDNDDQTGLANPASVYCETSGGELAIRTINGGEVGFCELSDERVCEEWAWYRSEGEECISPEGYEDTLDRVVSGELPTGYYPVQITDDFSTSDPITITAARLEGETTLVVEATHGGCATYDYALYVSPIVATSYPPQASATLYLDQHDDYCERANLVTLRFDLTPAIVEIGEVFSLNVIDSQNNAQTVMVGEAVIE
jgi:putative hemolysin